MYRFSYHIQPNTRCGQRLRDKGLFPFCQQVGSCEKRTCLLLRYQPGRASKALYLQCLSNVTRLWYILTAIPRPVGGLQCLLGLNRNALESNWNTAATPADFTSQYSWVRLTPPEALPTVMESTLELCGYSQAHLTMATFAKFSTLPLQGPITIHTLIFLGRLGARTQAGLRLDHGEHTVSLLLRTGGHLALEVAGDKTEAQFGGESSPTELHIALTLGSGDAVALIKDIVSGLETTLRVHREPNKVTPVRESVETISLVLEPVPAGETEQGCQGDDRVAFGALYLEPGGTQTALLDPERFPLLHLADMESTEGGHQATLGDVALTAQGDGATTGAPTPFTAAVSPSLFPADDPLGVQAQTANAELGRATVSTDPPARASLLASECLSLPEENGTRSLAFDAISTTLSIYLARYTLCQMFDCVSPRFEALW